MPTMVSCRPTPGSEGQEQAWCATEAVRQAHKTTFTQDLHYRTSQRVLVCNPPQGKEDIDPEVEAHFLQGGGQLN